MTGFASGTGASGPFSWTWDMRSVNARGLDLRLRIPDWLTGLEQGLRERLSKSLARGNVSLNLRVQRDGGAEELALNPVQLDRVLGALTEVSAKAEAKGLVLRDPSPAEILSMRGVLDANTSDGTAEKALATALSADFEGLLAAFAEMRAREGRELSSIMDAQLDSIEQLVVDAAGAVETRRDEVRTNMVEALRSVMDGTEGADPQRVAQELALIAVKSDVTEELDRLKAHVSAARDLLKTKGPVGRKLDFLMQEFNREANTLCSKSGNADLTRIGLDLKAVIDQMREQVQNVE